MKDKFWVDDMFMFQPCININPKLPKSPLQACLPVLRSHRNRNPIRPHHQEAREHAWWIQASWISEARPARHGRWSVVCPQWVFQKICLEIRCRGNCCKILIKNDYPKTLWWYLHALNFMKFVGQLYCLMMFHGKVPGILMGPHLP